ncbi:MAG: AAA-like domain-containing protein [Anaerolineaceae bacterium]|nr:AAA-like domain-containing protein [Anaerolineaceae bacterium]
MDNSIGVFISYSHQNRFEAATLTQELAKIGCQCWIDFQGIAGGAVWRESIEQALQNSMVTIVILTPESVDSEWVLYEIDRAKTYRQRIIPVKFRECKLPDELEPYQYIDFTQGPNYEHLFQSVVIAVTIWLRSQAHQPDTDSSRPVPIETSKEPQALLQPPVENVILERPDGTMRAESLFYIERQGDRILKRELSTEGATIVIKAPRQVGKSSMLVHSIRYSEEIGKKVAILDFQSLDTLSDPELFYQEFCAAISERLGLENQVAEVWKRTRSNTRACTVYMEQYVLSKLNMPLVLGIDETDRMFDCPFRSDFFGMLRSWHNSRGSGNEWRKLDMVLVISTEPYMLIENSAQSPFNVGEIIELEDFSKNDVEELNARHGNPFSIPELNELYKLTSGHPYLVRQALYRVAVNEITASSILDETTYTRRDGGIFADHLRRYQSYFNEQRQLKQKMVEIIHQRNAYLSDNDFHRLNGAGLIKTDRDRQVSPRCALYGLYFGAKLK